MPSLDAIMSYHRVMKAPLDDMEVFPDLRSLMDYCDNGASYDGQRVIVLNTQKHLIPSTEYVIVDNIPIIDMRGSEPIFKPITFVGDSSESHGMLIYENNMGGAWNYNEVFSLNNDKYCLLNQLEIFRILDANGDRSYKFYIERISRTDGDVITDSWAQTYNPYIDAEDHYIENRNNMKIKEMSFWATTDGWLKTNMTLIELMPRTHNGVNSENNYITKIYVKAEKYYQAYN